MIVKKQNSHTEAQLMGIFVKTNTINSHKKFNIKVQMPYYSRVNTNEKICCCNNSVLFTVLLEYSRNYRIATIQS